jgi:hypothetical protein
MFLLPRNGKGIMAEAPILLTEEQTLAHLKNEKWNRQGKLLLSQDTFTPGAASQYIKSMSQETRDTLKLRAQSEKIGGAHSDAKRLVMDAKGAETLFSAGGLEVRPVNRANTR